MAGKCACAVHDCDDGLGHGPLRLVPSNPQVIYEVPLRRRASKRKPKAACHPSSYRGHLLPPLLCACGHIILNILADCWVLCADYEGPLGTFLDAGSHRSGIKGA